MKKKTLSVLLAAIMVVTMAAGCQKGSGGNDSSSGDGELKGDITFWHSFTQGGRMDVIQEAADKFMESCIRKCSGYEYRVARACR